MEKHGVLHIKVIGHYFRLGKTLSLGVEPHIGRYTLGSLVIARNEVLPCIANSKLVVMENLKTFRARDHAY